MCYWCCQFAFILSTYERNMWWTFVEIQRYVHCQLWLLLRVNVDWLKLARVSVGKVEGFLQSVYWGSVVCDLIWFVKVPSNSIWPHRSYDLVKREYCQNCSLVVVFYVAVYSCTVIWAAYRFCLPDFASSHWVDSLCLDFFVCVRFSCLCFHCLVLYLHACCIIVTWWGETFHFKLGRQIDWKVLACGQRVSHGTITWSMWPAFFIFWH